METTQNQSFYITIRAKILFDKKLSSSDKILYGIITNFANLNKGCCFKSYKQLAELTERTKRSIIYSINNLIKCGYIEKYYKNDKPYFVPSEIVAIEQYENHRERNIDLYDWLNDEEEN